MAVKRRVIWLSDEEWAILQASAKEHHTTVSGIIRDMWATAVSVPPDDPVAHEAATRRIVARAITKLARDPYTEVRPVPKPGRK